MRSWIVPTAALSVLAGTLMLTYPWSNAADAAAVAEQDLLSPRERVLLAVRLSGVTAEDLAAAGLTPATLGARLQSLQSDERLRRAFGGSDADRIAAARGEARRAARLAVINTLLDGEPDGVVALRLAQDPILDRIPRDLRHCVESIAHARQIVRDLAEESRVIGDFDPPRDQAAIDRLNALRNSQTAAAVRARIAATRDALAATLR
jgi:hypothetical protein